MSEIQKIIFLTQLFLVLKGSTIMGICLGMHILCKLQIGKGSGFNFFKYDINLKF